MNSSTPIPRDPNSSNGRTAPSEGDDGGSNPSLGTETIMETLGKNPNDPALHAPYDTIEEELNAWFEELSLFLDTLGDE